ncbi:kelch-like protein 26 isoform X1 [Lates japonicus]|uniref:Kelch-like protein 26 isoform X1 n=1 Tax=Lates japonicus TaxID=270547 RepID=A0AAD3NLQ3_LATJO|nr:kelch-like protein 26 isoform X1 [Lates japonicus]
MTSLAAWLSPATSGLARAPPQSLSTKVYHFDITPPVQRATERWRRVQPCLCCRIDNFVYAVVGSTCSNRSGRGARVDSCFRYDQDLSQWSDSIHAGGPTSLLNVLNGQLHANRRANRSGSLSFRRLMSQKERSTYVETIKTQDLGSRGTPVRNYISGVTLPHWTTRKLYRYDPASDQWDFRAQMNELRGCMIAPRDRGLRLGGR